MSILNQKGEEAAEEEKSTSLKLLEAIVVILFPFAFCKKIAKKHFICVSFYCCCGWVATNDLCMSLVVPNVSV